MTLGQALQNRLDERGDSQRVAAEAIGVSQQVFSRWVIGQTSPKAEYIPAIARYLGVTQAEVREMRTAPARPRHIAQRMDALEERMATIEELLTRLVDRRGRGAAR